MCVCGVPIRMGTPHFRLGSPTASASAKLRRGRPTPPLPNLVLPLPNLVLRLRRFSHLSEIPSDCPVAYLPGFLAERALRWRVPIGVFCPVKAGYQLGVSAKNIRAIKAIRTTAVLIRSERAAIEEGCVANAPTAYADATHAACLRRDQWRRRAVKIKLAAMALALCFGTKGRGALAGVGCAT